MFGDICRNKLVKLRLVYFVLRSIFTLWHLTSEQTKTKPQTNTGQHILPEI